MNSPKDIFNELKNILEHSSAPSQLNDHPWTKSLLVRQFVAEMGDSSTNSPGYQLLAALGKLFRETMPSTPPREGQRLDTQWGRLGILASLVFPPFER